MQGKTSIRLFLLLVFAIPVSAYALFVYLEKGFKKLPVYGKTTQIDGEKKEHRIPDFEFTNQDALLAGSNKWTDRIAVANFFFTHCPVICPKMTKSLQRVQLAFDSDEIFINSFSIDPERDTPLQLKAYAQKYVLNNDNWQLLTGEKKAIYRLARNAFMVVATDGDGGPGDFIHSEKLVLIDRQRRIRGYYDGTSEKEISTLIDDIRILKHEK